MKCLWINLIRRCVVLPKGLIFNIQKFSVHDGPGIRTIVFLKGCPLKCRWCANPEGIDPVPQIAFKFAKCIGQEACGYCEKICTKQAISWYKNLPHIDREACNHCGKCADICPSKAMTLFGEYKSVDDILDKVKEDQAFYHRSNGGITLSGGEALRQADFSAELLQKAKQSGLKTALETSCYAPWDNIEKTFQYVDHLFIDLKSADQRKHELFTGVNPKHIWENVARICQVYIEKPIIFRTPVIPDFNDTAGEIQKIIDLIISFSPNYSRIKYELLPYHAYGVNKYKFLEKEYAMQDIPNLDKEKVRDIMDELYAPFEVFIT